MIQKKKYITNNKQNYIYNKKIKSVYLPFINRTICRTYKKKDEKNIKSTKNDQLERPISRQLHNGFTTKENHIVVKYENPPSRLADNVTKKGHKND